ncbi:NPP1 family protein [Bacillus gaemokensis]|uniref:Necrosis inducing protein (NPP1) n=1 Tax=Bacillus gaemokensis TaxID=574375 RepID=A0A073K2N6_9BACI|nr:NPP1 family protein [Bacillus gaemokensis]KEK20760.1 hypothetical protein BAGA_29640 [Bacillus gaemokensis]KYG30511.1 hypothetical protein AZF08_27725 [Bacillus gaemokensis]
MNKKGYLSIFCSLAVLASGANVAFAENTSKPSSVQASQDPTKFLPTLQFDGTDWSDSGEQNFPQAFRFQSYDDNIEHNKENLIRFKIGESVSGIGSTGWQNRGPNDQRPAVYFHSVTKGNYEVYEYWLYYADNDWINDHEHDWEKYFVYLKDGEPTHLLISNHNGYKIKPWSDIPKDNNHPLIGVDGGSHAMKWKSEDGVQIRYNGEISKNNGRLDEGDNSIQQWVIYSNDTLKGVLPYLNKPDIFYYGDPEYKLNSNEYGDPRDAPWKRAEWNTPPLP